MHEKMQEIGKQKCIDKYEEVLTTDK